MRQNLAVVNFIAVSLMALTLFSQVEGVKPEDVLSDSASFIELNGVQARKGSIGASISNINELNMLAVDSHLSCENQKLQAILADQIDLMPALYAVGMFDLFSINEWLVPKQGEGRVWLGVLLLEIHPELQTAANRRILCMYKDLYTQALQARITQLLAR